MDFYSIKETVARNGMTSLSPAFSVKRTRHLMVQGKAFKAVWDENEGLWSTDEYDVARLVDADILRYKAELEAKSGMSASVKLMSDFSSDMWKQFKSYLTNMPDSYHELDQKVTFSNDVVKIEDYVSKRLPYPLEHGEHKEYDEILDTLYDEEEREKIEWAIGAILTGDAKNIQKFLVFYGPGGTGKSTVLNIIQKLFAGYYTSFEAKALTGNNNAFATEVFKGNPLVAIQHDGDLSKIEDNAKLNSIVSHEEMTMNEKYKASYMSRINAFLLMGTNKPVKITDAKSGLIRRLIDVAPTGNLIAPERYRLLYSLIDFQLGAIAAHCIDVYRELGKDYYSGYRPTDMMMKTDIFFNYIEEHYDIFKEQDGVTLNQAYEMYKQFCESSLVDFKLAKFKFREELKNYFTKFEDRTIIDGQRVRSWYSGFDLSRFVVKEDEEPLVSLSLESTTSIFDETYPDAPAQYANANGTPGKFWDASERTMTDPKDGVRKEMIPPEDYIVKTTLSDLDTSRLHYVKPPLNHIVIDFDLTDDSGEKSAEKNIKEASKWPPTYTEYSKSGSGVHLHYIYDGDPNELSRVYDEGIEIKVFTGNSSLRRRMSLCNTTPIAHINSGLPLKEKKVISGETLKSEKSLRNMIQRNLNKEFHAGTKPSMDFIDKILRDAYNSGMSYDVTDLQPRLMVFANGSTNQALACLKIFQGLKLKSEVQSEDSNKEPSNLDDDRLVFFDCEVYPNLFVISWKFEDSPTKVRMINPKPHEVEALFNLKLVGFNCRKYDNHILYAASMGYTNAQLFQLSQDIINKVPGCFFAEAYNLSYADIFDYASKKQGLKKWQFELGIHHMEMEIPWDQPVPPELVDKVCEYCDNDVDSTEAVHKARQADFSARKILADLSGLSVNTTGNTHSGRIVFGGNRKTQGSMVYTDLSEMFPGYKYEFGKSSYRGEDPGEGGYVYAEPGMYTDVALLDVASMHPASIEQLNLFGEYTKNFNDLKYARLAIKHEDYEKASKMFDGKLAPYLKNKEDADALSYALKLVINSVYGLTSAKFDNPFRDIRNVDNIVAKRGALFMIDLKNFVQEQGFTVAHIKTDSIKIPNATPEIIQAVFDFGKKYGYDFEHEYTYSKMTLLNDAVYAAKIGWAPKEKEIGKWTSTGSPLIHPYIFKTLFSKEKPTFEDMCETKSVTSALYLDFNADRDEAMALEDPAPQFVGKVGQFVPVVSGAGGGLLQRIDKEGKFHSATGAKGYLWMEAQTVKALGKEDDIDMSYYKNLTDKAADSIAKFGDIEWFLS